MQRARERGSDIVGAYQKRREFERCESNTVNGRPLIFNGTNCWDTPFEKPL